MPNWDTTQRYNIVRFRGLDESIDENALDAGATADCLNMDTKDGNLAVGMGYRKIGLPRLNDDGIRAFYHWHTLRPDCWLIATSTVLAAWDGAQWAIIYAYQDEVSSTEWDFKEVRIGTQSYLLIANGETEVVKWNGTAVMGAGERFGTGLWVYEGTVAAMTYSATKAEDVKYAEKDDIGRFTLTMPQSWTFSEGALIAFSVPSVMNVSKGAWVQIGDDAFVLDWLPIWTTGDTAVVQLSKAAERTCSSLASASESTAVSSFTYAEADNIGTFTVTMPADWKFAQEAVITLKTTAAVTATERIDFVVGGITYKLDTVPTWAANTTVYIKLMNTGKSVKSDTPYGVVTVTLSAAIDAKWVDRCKNIGLRVNEITRAVKEIDETRLIVTFKEPITAEVKVGDSCQIRGQVSNIPVNYLEMYYSRLFAAGDNDNPSRLYWSQPPADTRTIEDWSMDDVSSATGGGFVDVGETFSDPIIGLCAISNQLLIFKRTSIYRMLGSSPANYRVMLVTKEIENTANSSIITDGDVPYWLTNNGMYLHDGQTARLIPNSRQIQKTLDAADVTGCHAAKNRDRLYFTIKRSGNDMIVVYDIIDRAYMLRNGFSVVDICADNGNLYMLCPDGYIYQWDEKCRRYGMEQDYTGGTLIDAYWNTPFTDFGAKSISKKLTSMFYRGEGGVMRIDSKVGKFVTHKAYQMPADTGDIVKIKLENEGRAFGFKLYNEYGSWFRILGGIEVRYENKEDAF